jgi:hypothetical protein
MLKIDGQDRVIDLLGGSRAELDDPRWRIAEVNGAKF